MADPLIVLVVLVALIVGLAIGWVVGSRGAAAARAARDSRESDFRKAITDLAAAQERASVAAGLAETLEQVRSERDSARTDLATLRAQAEAFEARLAELRAAKDVMAAQFSEVAGKLLGEAQQQFLDRAEARFRQSEEVAGQNLRSMLQPVSERLQKYEETVTKVETDRRSAFDELKGQLEGLRLGQEKVSAEAAKLVNSLRNAPKSRGRWGEQQLRNVLDNCGLSEHADFQTEVSVDLQDGARLRPDVVINVPGGQSLVIDAKVSLNAYQDAFGAVDEVERKRHLDLHAQSMRAHVNGLGNKAYWSQFSDAPDFVIMFVPGEHFLSAALEQDPTLWDFAFEKRVLLATPTNLIAIARTVAAVWRQERLAKEARQIGELGKEMYDRLTVAAQHLKSVGSGLSGAVNNYNKFVGSFERNLMSTGRKFRNLDMADGGKELEQVPEIEALARYGDTVPLIGRDLDQAAE